MEIRDTWVPGKGTPLAKSGIEALHPPLPKTIQTKLQIIKKGITSKRHLVTTLREVAC